MSQTVPVTIDVGAQVARSLARGAERMARSLARPSDGPDALAFVADRLLAEYLAEYSEARHNLQRAMEDGEGCAHQPLRTTLASSALLVAGASLLIAQLTGAELHVESANPAN